MPRLSLLLHAVATAASSSNRTVSWWLADYNAAAIPENTAFVNSPAIARALSSTLHCCDGPRVEANGTLVRSTAQEDLFASIVKAERAATSGAMRTAPILFSLSPDPAAIESGAAIIHAIAGLVAIATRIGCDGWVVDYEPHANTTEAHAVALAAFVAALGDALRLEGRIVALCVSDWGVLNFYAELSASRADLYVSMSNTYGGKGVVYEIEAKLDVVRMLATFPAASVVVGIGTVAPASCNCVFGNTGNCTSNYYWTESTLTAFVQWLEAQGVGALAVWRADIYPQYCATGGAPRGVSAWMAPIFAAFIETGRVPTTIKV
jgi:hypothetical protein